MTITVKRLIYTQQSTQGEMLLDGAHECWTLEPRRDPTKGKPYCIPGGTYHYQVLPSVHFNRNVIVVGNVPGFTAIEVHPGNFPKDTHGCCLVGETKGPDFVGMSDAAFDDLMGKVPSEGIIEYVDFPEPNSTTKEEVVENEAQSQPATQTNRVVAFPAPAGGSSEGADDQSD